MNDSTRPAPEPETTGVDLHRALQQTSESPGVYLMKDAAGEVIYVGKARNLKKRLTSYFQKTTHASPKTDILMERVASFETILTESEKEALILESNLIKKHRPRYNVVLKDDKRYLSLRLDVKETYPALEIVRKVENDGALYFGPYPSAQSARRTLKFIEKVFRLRKCKLLHTRLRPCLHCQMAGCLAPCCRDVPREEYAEVVREAVLFLRGRTAPLVGKIRTAMQEAAERQEFERAAALRDKLSAIERTVEKQISMSTDFTDRDVMGIAESSGHVVAALLYIRGGYLLGSRHFSFFELLSSGAEAAGAFIRQYYRTGRFIPEEILVPDLPEDAPVLEEMLGQIRGKRAHIRAPRRGEKVRLVHMAVQNARQALENESASMSRESDRLERLAGKLGLTRFPGRIECFDNSTTAGAEAVSAMVVFANGEPAKDSYRHFRIRSAPANDDYAAMREVLLRRFAPEKETSLPDLLMIDGGKGQLGIAVAVTRELGLEGRFDILGIAKRDESRGESEDKIFLPGRANPVQFGREGDLLLFLQRIRDEAHRFAIGFHRKRRSRRSLQSLLDQVPDIGPKRKRALFLRFGSIEKIRAATSADLEALPEMNRKAAEAVLSALRKERDAGS